jgi:hypothetical protein
MSERMKKDTIGTYPYQIDRKDGELIIRFFPKIPEAQDPNHAVFKLTFDAKDRQKLIRILSENK